MKTLIKIIVAIYATITTIGTLCFIGVGGAIILAPEYVSDLLKTAKKHGMTE